MEECEGSDKLVVSDLEMSSLVTIQPQEEKIEMKRERWMETRQHDK